MKTRPNSHDVAARAGVSRSMVSLVLSGPKDAAVRAETRDRVLAAARELNYRPNAAAQALVTGRTGMVDLWVPYTYNSIYSTVIQHTIDEGKERGYRVLVSQHGGSDPGASSLTDLIHTSQVDGIIGHDSQWTFHRLIQEAGSNMPPLVSIGPIYSKECDYVGTDLYEGSRKAVRHLVEIGCQSIAFLTADTSAYASKSDDCRWLGYSDVLDSAGMTPQTLVIKRAQRNLALPAVLEFFKSSRRTDGLFCWNDESASAAIRALHMLGIRVPDDVAVIGVDGIEELEYSVPTVSTVAQPVERMVSLAWEFLSRRLENPDVPPQQVILPMTLIQRESTTKT